MERLYAEAQKPTQGANKHANDLKNVSECVNADDVPQSEPPATAKDGDKRAWLIAQGLGRNMLAAARLLSKYTRFCVDFEVNADGTIAATSFNSPAPLWHEAEDAFDNPNVKRTVARLQIPLICESAGSWATTAAGFAAWATQSQQLRASVGKSLVAQFF